jgi:hypothetical protein
MKVQVSDTTGDAMKYYRWRNKITSQFFNRHPGLTICLLQLIQYLYNI